MREAVIVSTARTGGLIAGHLMPHLLQHSQHTALTKL